MTFIWHGTKAGLQVDRIIRQRVKEACIAVERDIKLSMVKGGSTESGGKRQKGEKKSKVGTFRSKPGEVPRVQTGTLRRSITHEMHPVLPEGRVGTNVEYGKYLELGTRHMLPRPFIRPSLARMLPFIRAIFGRKFRIGL